MCVVIKYFAKFNPTQRLILAPQKLQQHTIHANHLMIFATWQTLENPTYSFMSFANDSDHVHQTYTQIEN